MSRPVTVVATVVVLGTGLAIGLLSLGCGGGTKPEPEPVLGSDDPDLSGPDFFADATAGSGINFAYRNGEEGAPKNLSILESLGGGLAAIDFNGDGLLDLFVVGGTFRRVRQQRDSRPPVPPLPERG